MTRSGEPRIDLGLDYPLRVRFGTITTHPPTAPANGFEIRHYGGLDAYTVRHVHYARFSFQGALFPYRTAPLLEILADGRHADPEWPSLVITWAYCACLPDPGFWFRVPLDVRARVAYRLGTEVGRDPGALRPSAFLQRISRPIGR